MLIEVSIENVFSFSKKQSFSLYPANDPGNTSEDHRIFASGIKSPEYLFKAAGIFGANASGKTNLIKALTAFKNVVLSSSRSLDDEDVQRRFPPPFFLDGSSIDATSTIELIFIQNSKRFRYGIEFTRSEIHSEWLYCAKKARETLYFAREGANIEINLRSFAEAEPLTEVRDGKRFTKMTRSETPFLSVVAQFDGSVSKEVTDWFKNLRFISGIVEEGFRNYSSKKYEKDEKFRIWALEILAPFQIDGIEIVDRPIVDGMPTSSKVDPEINEIISSIQSLAGRHNLSNKGIEIIKKGVDYEAKFPLHYESIGTSKLIYLLGPLYDAIMNSRVLFIDELDSKFHTLLTYHILNLFYKSSNHGSQIIFTAHDTNLLSEALLKRDQIWFADKSESQSTSLYSLLEYKEYYARKNSSYSKDYLLGKYSAIPLFKNMDEIRGLLNA